MIKSECDHYELCVQSICSVILSNQKYIMYSTLWIMAVFFKKKKYVVTGLTTV